MAKKKTEKKPAAPPKRHWDWNDPLEPIYRESGRANQALWDYALLGAGRSYQVLIQTYTNPIPTATGEKPPTPPTKHIATIKGWGVRYDWQARVARWDVIQSEGLLEVYQARRVQLVEKNWDQAEKLRAKVMELLEIMPTFYSDETIETVKDGQNIKIIKMRMNATISQIATALEKAAKLQALTTDMPTDNINLLSGAALESQIESLLTDFAELQRIKDGENTTESE